MSAAILPRKLYYRVWLVLMVLLLLTWGLALINLGPLNIIVILVIALAKTTLALLFFMHVKQAPRLTWLFVAAGFIWLLIMIDLTRSDYLTRGAVPAVRPTWRQPGAEQSTPQGLTLQPKRTLGQTPSSPVVRN